MKGKKRGKDPLLSANKFIRGKTQAYITRSKFSYGFRMSVFWQQQSRGK